MNEQRIRLADLDDIPADQGLEVVAAGRVLALFRDGDQVFALDGVCPHQGGPLGKGVVCQGIVTCPWHGWQFDIRTGQSQLARTIRQPVIPVIVAQNQVWVRRGDLVE